MNLSFTPSCVGAIVVEFPEERNYVLTSQQLPLPSSDLTYEYTTLESDHSPVASSVFRWYRSVLSHFDPENSGKMITEMINVFRQNKNELAVPLREYILSGGIVEACYRFQIEDSHLICQVLDLLYDTWSSFGPLHFRGILKPNRFKLHKKSDRKSKTLDFLSFFLEHARRKKMEYNGTRMIDVSVYYSMKKSPVFVAAHIWCWKPLLRYLQYGARFEDVMVDPTSTHHGVKSALTDTFRILIRQMWIRLVHPAIEMELVETEEIKEYCSNLTTEVKDLCKTLTILLRAVKLLRHDVLDQDDQWVVEMSSQEMLAHTTLELMLPTLKKRHRCPVELQHGCRWVIRDRLNENWQLPTGIQSLPIPNKMKRYINLLSG